MTPDLTTRIPFAFARSGLFRPGNASSSILVDAVIPSSRDYAIELTSTGPALRACHGLAWQTLVALAIQQHGHLAPIDVWPAEILRLMGRQGEIQSRARTWLRGLLDDLAACSVAASTPIHAYVGPLLASVAVMDDGKLSISFDPELSRFVENEYVAVPLSQKSQLGDHPLAHWLHDYIATHRDTYVASVAAIHRLCGSTLTPSKFRARLRDALDLLASGPSALIGYTLDGDQLTLRKHKTTVVRLTKSNVVAFRAAPSRAQNAVSQARHQRARVAL